MVSTKTICKLCNLPKLTEWLEETSKFIVCECITCKVPMYVWKKHEFPIQREIDKMIKHAKKHYPDKRIDMNMRAIPDHFHFHLREKS